MPGNAGLGPVRGKNPIEHRVLLTKIPVHGIGEIVDVSWRIPSKGAHGPGKRTAPLQTHQFPRLFHRQHAQKHLIEEREDGGIGADAQRQREHHGDRKSRRFAQPAQPVTNVLDQRIHASSPSVYSVRKACIGSMEAARRAGSQLAAAMASARTPSALAMDIAFNGLTPKTSEDSSRAAPAASTTPNASPMSAMPAVSRNTSSEVASRDAPSAMRMPISRRRCVTRNAK